MKKNIELFKKDVSINSALPNGCERKAVALFEQLMHLLDGKFGCVLSTYIIEVNSIYVKATLDNGAVLCFDLFYNTDTEAYNGDKSLEVFAIVSKGNEVLKRSYGRLYDVVGAILLYAKDLK